MVLAALSDISFFWCPLEKDCHNTTGGTGKEMASVHCEIVGNTTKSAFQSNIAFLTLSLPLSTRSGVCFFFRYGNTT